MNLSAPARACRICSYKLRSAHFFRRAGPLCGRLAFCANLVFGRLIVFFSSSGGASVGINTFVIKGGDSNNKLSGAAKIEDDGSVIRSLLRETLKQSKARTPLLFETMVRAFPAFDVFAFSR